MISKVITTRNMIVLAIASLAIFLWLNRSPGPSPFFAGAKHSDDPLNDVFEQVITRLAKTPFEIKVIGDQYSSGTDSRKTFAERTKTILCSQDAAKEMAAEMEVWCEFAATRAGARVQRGPCEYGEKQTVFSFRYEYPRIKGLVTVTMTPPEKSAEDLKKRQSSGGSIDLTPYLYKLHWEVRESPSS